MPQHPHNKELTAKIVKMKNLGRSVKGAAGDMPASSVGETDPYVAPSALNLFVPCYVGPSA